MSYELIPFIKEEKVDLFSRLLWANKKYAKTIEVKSYVLTSEQIKLLVNEPLQEPLQLSNKELEQKLVHLVLRVKNRSEAVAWGTMAYKLKHVNWASIDIICFPSKFGETQDYILPLGAIFLGAREELPEVQLKWTDLYAVW